MKPTRSFASKFLFAVALLFPALVTAQTLDITNGIQTYAGLTNTIVTMTGRSELRVTATNNPIPGCTINLNSSDAWFFLPSIKPSVVASAYLGQVFVNGTNAVSGNNVRVIQYGMGTVVIPHAPSYQPLQVFTGTNFTGSSNYLSQYVAYSDANLGAFANGISSFHLKRGYTATFAQNSDGSGISKNFVAADGDLDVSIMPAGLNDSASFIRIFPWRWTPKKGIAGDPGIGLLNLRWWYNWDINQNSSLDSEYVAIKQQPYWPSLSQSWQTRGINTVLGYNEPDNSTQDAYKNLNPPGSISDAVSHWPELLSTGLRVGSPATTDGGRGGWLYPFMQQADAANLRVDFVAIHYYQCHTPSDAAGAASQMYNFLLDIYNNTHRPIWVTEWNNGADWTGCGDPTYAQQQAAVSAMMDMLESTPFVERYALYNWVEDVRSVVTNGVLTPAGITYRDKASSIGYIQDGIPGNVRSIARFQFENDVLDNSGAGNNGIAVGIPTYTTGTNDQAIQLDGTNSYVVLPLNTANTPGFTFAAWVNWDGGANWQRIFDFGNDTSHYLFLTPSSGNGTLRFAINNGGGEQLVQIPSALAVGQWQHVAVTLSNNIARLYFNGVLAASSNNFSILPSQINPKRNYLGKSQFPDPLFRGRLDEVILAHYPLSAAEIAALQTNQPPAFLNIGNGIWTSDANGNWSDTSRWSGGLPATGAGYTADFTFNDITANRIVTLDSTRSISALKFGDASGAQNWTLTSSGGSILTLDSASSAQPSVTVNQNTATISSPLAGTNGLVKTGAGTLVLSGANALSGSINIDTGSTGNYDGVMRIAGPNAISNISTIWIRNNNSGSSTLQYDGSLGTVLGPQTIRLSGRNTNAVAIQNISGSNSINALTIDVGGSFYVLQSDAGTLNLGGTVSSLATGTRAFTFQGNGNFSLSGSIQNGSAATINLLKTNSGTLTISGASTFSGTTTNWRGNLFVNGSLASPVTIVAGTLGGRGTISGAVTVQSGATISPGASVGILTVNNTITLQSGSTTLIELNKANSTNDLLRTTGGLNYSGTLSVVNLGGTLMPGDSFKLFQASSYNGSFNLFSLPSLSTGLAWDTSGLTNGIIKVIATATPQFDAIAQMNDGNFQLSGSGAAFKNYELWAATNLNLPMTWFFVTNTVADTNGLFNFADPDATNYPQQFYRIVSP
jgi:autotransporter-associated beta strand protein